MELVFIIDSSESVGKKNFKKIQDFVISLVDRTTIGPNATRIGLVLYSHYIQLVFNLAQYTTKEEVKQVVRNMTYGGEGTHTGEAIRNATEEAFLNARPGVTKVAIVITDGQTDEREPINLASAVEAAHAAKIVMYAVGIYNTSGPRQNELKRELELIASNPEHVYPINDYNTLSGD